MPNLNGKKIKKSHCDNLKVNILAGCCEVDRNGQYRFDHFFSKRNQHLFRFVSEISKANFEKGSKFFDILSKNFEKRLVFRNFPIDFRKISIALFRNFLKFRKIRKFSKFSEPKRYFEKFRNTLHFYNYRSFEALQNRLVKRPKRFSFKIKQTTQFVRAPL